MKLLKLISIATAMIATFASSSAFSAPLKVDTAIQPVIDSLVLQPVRIPVIQQINPVLVNNFAVASKDYKTFHGSICQPYNGDQQGDVDHRDNGLYNEASGTRTVVCPVVRDNVNKTSGVWVDISVNNPAGKTFSCWVDSRNKYGSLIKWVNKKTSLSGNRTLHIDVYDMVKDGTFNLYCSVPAKGRIASFKTGEILRTDSNN